MSKYPVLDTSSGCRLRVYLQGRGTYKLLSNCSYSPLYRVTAVMGLITSL